MEDTEQTPEPARGAPDQPVVQVNVEEDFAIGGGSSPVCEGATVEYGHTRRRTIALIAAATITVMLLALPVIWGLIELVSLARVIGPLILAWAVLLVALIAAALAIGVRLARTGL